MQHHRTLFLSDLHLGSKLTKADNVVDFLRHNDAETIYLVGDIFDISRMRRAYHWPRSHREIVDLLKAKARRGRRIVYVPGNHDRDLRQRARVRSWLPGLEVADRAVHVTADGRRLLVVHGDEHEEDRASAPVAIKAGIVCYLLGVRLSDTITRARRRLGLSYWSLSAAVKARTLDRIHLVQAFKRNLAADARASGCHGVVAGHVHHPAIEFVDGVLYCNDGDWVESCSALSEDSDGALSIIRWRGWSATSRRRTPRPRCISEPVRG